jgi:hypothetical protein
MESTSDEIKQKYNHLVDAWLEKTSLSQENPWYSAVDALRQVRTGHYDAGTASVGLLQENIKDDMDATYDRYRASVAYDVNTEFQRVMKGDGTSGYFPALERMFKLAIAQENSTSEAVPSSLEHVANAAYKAYNSRRLLKEVGQQVEPEDRTRFVEEAYSTILEMRTHPATARSLLQAIERHMYDDGRCVAVVDGIRDYLSGEQIDSKKLEETLLQAFDPRNKEVVEPAGGYIERVLKGRNNGGQDIELH